MKTPTVPELHITRCLLTNRHFRFPLEPSEADSCRVRILHQGKGIWCAMPRWHAFICLGGTQFILASISTKDDVNAGQKIARYADMARMYFWRYKQRNRREPQPGELNITVARAKRDLESEPEIVELLQQQEKILLKAGLIKLYSVEEPNIPARMSTNSKTLLAVSDLSTRLINLQTEFREVKSVVNEEAKSIKDVGSTVALRLDGQLSMLGELSKRLDAVQSQQSQIIQILQSLVNRILDSGAQQNNCVASPAAPVLSSCQLNK